MKLSFPIKKPYVIFARHGDKIRYGIHRGIDVCKYDSTGKKIISGYTCYAPADYTVEENKWHYQGGNILLLNHGGGIKSWMAHFERTLVHKGEKGKRGDPIAVVDTTPNNYWSGPTPHLHWHLYVNGQVEDPLKYINEMIAEPNRVIFNKKDGEFYWTKNEGYLKIPKERMVYAALMKAGDTITVDDDISPIIGNF